MKLFNNTFDLIEKAMDLEIRRHSVLSSNVVNSETPNYTAKDLDFSNELQRALAPAQDDLTKTSPLHMDLEGANEAHAVSDYTGAMGADGNNVDLDIAMGKIADNSRSYSNAATWLGVQLRLLKSAARGRSGV